MFMNLYHLPVSLLKSKEVSDLLDRELATVWVLGTEAQS